MNTIRLQVLILVIAAAAIGLSSCKKSRPENDMQAISLNSNMGFEMKATKSSSMNSITDMSNKSPMSKLQDTQIETDREVSFFVNDAVTASTVYYNNVVLTADGDGTFSHTDMYYPLNGANVNFYAVHPYSASTNLAGLLDFSVKTDQSTDGGYLDSDLLYAAKSNISATKSAVELQFVHKLSKLDFTIKVAEGMDLVDLSSVKIAQVKNNTSLNILTGALASALGDDVVITAHNVTASAADETEVSGISAIVVPQTVASGEKLFVITIGSTDYIYTTTKALTFDSGKKYNLQLTIKPTGIELISSIQDWTEGDTIIGEGEAE